MAGPRDSEVRVKPMSCGIDRKTDGTPQTKGSLTHTDDGHTCLGFGELDRARAFGDKVLAGFKAKHVVGKWWGPGLQLICKGVCAGVCVCVCLLCVGCVSLMSAFLSVSGSGSEGLCELVRVHDSRRKESDASGAQTATRRPSSGKHTFSMDYAEARKRTNL